MSGKYILINDKPVLEPDLIKWAKWFETANDQRIVKKTQVGDASVSTVFLGIDHNFVGSPPILYETMVFGGAYDGETNRYSTRQEAEEGHEEMVGKVHENPSSR